MRLSVFAAQLLVLGAVVVLLGGCERSNAAGSDRVLPAVRLGYFANVTHAQAVLGAASGDFAAAVQPSRFETRVFNAGPALIEALFAREIDVGYVGPGPVLSAFAQSHGEGIRVISGSAANGVLIVARAGSGIHSPADLKGKRIATPQYGNTQDVAARHYVVDVLHEASANNVLAVANSEQPAMMQRGQIDAAWVPEPYGSRLMAEMGATLVSEQKDFWPGKEFALAVMVTTPEFLANHADVVEKLLVVHDRWTKRLQENPQQYAGPLEQALATLTGKKLPAELIGSALKHVTFTDDPLPATFQTVGGWAYDLGLAREPARLNGLFAPRRAAVPMAIR